MQNVCIHQVRTVTSGSYFEITVRPRQNGRHFPDDIFKCIFLNENVWISIKISLKFVPKGPINSIPSFIQIMAWRGPGNKSSSEAMMVSLLTHIYATRPQCDIRHVHLFPLFNGWKCTWFRHTQQYLKNGMDKYSTHNSQFVVFYCGYDTVNLISIA